jgi:catechol 2,3-dioxygenase-like lactoylglutathione lyase family enzyme
MLSALRHLALEVKYLDRARAFYADRLGLAPARETDTEVAFPVGDAELVLRRPAGVPRGGLHVHYAFSTPEGAYGEWRERLADLDPDEHEFGSYRSLYVDDPDGHCVEIGDNGKREAGAADAGHATGDGRTADRPPLTDVFEIVLEVESLDAAVSLYEALGFEPYDRGESRRRVRLSGPFDLELWEPQLGLADARGGVHADLAFGVDGDPSDVIAAVGDRLGEPVRVETPHGPGLRARDPDGHYLTFVGAGGE